MLANPTSNWADLTLGTLHNAEWRKALTEILGQSPAMTGGPGVSSYLPSWRAVTKGIFDPFNEHDNWLGEEHIEAFVTYPRGHAYKEEARKRLQQEFYADTYKAFRKAARGFTVPLRVYRAVALASPDDLRLDPIGAYWAWDARYAKAWDADEYEEDIYLLVGEVAPEDVNWFDTTVRNTVRPDEKEIAVKRGHRVRLLAVLDPDGNVISTEVREARANPRRRC